MKKLLLMTGLIAISSQTYAETVYSTDFNAAAGFYEGKSIDRVDGWQAQEPGFYAKDVAGKGYASTTNDWMRAKNTASFSIEGTSVVLTAEIRFNTILSGQKIFIMGISDSSLHTGQEIPAIGAVFSVHKNGVSFGDGVANTKWAALDAVQDDTLRLTATFTKSTDSGVFDVVTDFYNVTDQADLGDISFSATDSGTWSAAWLCASMRGMMVAEGVDRLDIDSFKIETL